MNQIAIRAVLLILTCMTGNAQVPDTLRYNPKDTLTLDQLLKLPASYKFKSCVMEFSSKHEIMKEQITTLSKEQWNTILGFISRLKSGDKVILAKTWVQQGDIPIKLIDKVYVIP
jgi:hypothetical protein